MTRRLCASVACWCSTARCVVLVTGLTCCATSYAGFLEMPEIEEVPQAENDILLKDLDIPNVRDRFPNPDAGPRLNVTEFRIQGIVEYPELGITREKLIEEVENIRYDMMDEGDLLYSGYTLEELSELQDLIIDIEKETKEEHVTPIDVQRIVFLIRDQRRRRGITLGMLETVADKITDYYRQRGFFLAKAFVPEQTVRDGIVTLTLLLGNLGDAPLNNSRLYSQRVVDGIFRNAYGKPVTNDGMEEKLYYLNDMPGLFVQGIFAPGDQVGDTKLNINVLQESAYNVSVRTDNHGSDITGEYRLFANFMLNNPLKYGDRLHLSLLGAVEPESSTYGSVSYGGPFFHYRWDYDLAVSRNAFTLAFEQNRTSNANIGGVSKGVDFGLRYKLSRSRVNTSSLGMGMSYIDASLKYVSGDVSSIFNNDQTLNTSLHYNFDILREKSRSVHTGAVRMTYSRVVDSIQYDVSDFDSTWILGAEYTMLRFINMPFDWRPIRLVVRGNLQYAGQQLLSVNQFSLSGPTRSRAYKTNTFFADDGLHLGADIIFERLPFGLAERILQPFIFTDAAYGSTYLPGNNQDKNTAELMDIGVGLKITPAKGMRGNFSIATPTRSKITSDLDIEAIKDTKVYLDFQYGF